ncbi:MAG: VOC family protein [Acidobacteria bacterium]|nr:VOC family protein [Acidobacteriota bacterium]
MSTATLKPAIPQLPSGDIDKTATFFEMKLNFEIAARFPEHKYLIVRRGLAEIHFWQTATEPAAKAIGSQSSCYIRVENIEALFDEFKTTGAPFRYELTQQPWGMNEVQIDDPYGNAIRFGERIA